MLSYVLTSARPPAALADAGRAEFAGSTVTSSVPVEEQYRRFGAVHKCDSLAVWPVGRGERKLQQFQLAGSVQRFLFAPCAVSDPFTTQRPLLSCRTLRVFRTDALEQWRAAVARSRRRIGRVLSGRLKLGWPRPRDIAPLSVRR
jgi:hypothetical protein